jgi:hypothetical protein
VIAHRDAFGILEGLAHLPRMRTDHHINRVCAGCKGHADRSSEKSFAFKSEQLLRFAETTTRASGKNNGWK